MHYCSISIASTLDILQFCTKPSICNLFVECIIHPNSMDMLIYCSVCFWFAIGSFNPHTQWLNHCNRIASLSVNLSRAVWVNSTRESPNNDNTCPQQRNSHAHPCAYSIEYISIAAAFAYLYMRCFIVHHVNVAGWREYIKTMPKLLLLFIKETSRFISK